jgi:alpha-glucosidase (family GH31 glycosyl hydrolase)
MNILILEGFLFLFAFSRLWIDMNEPANFDTNKEKPFNWPPNKPPWNLICPNNNYDDPPYVPLIAAMANIKRMSDMTLCMSGLQGEADEFIHYNVHNLYGWSQTEPTLK